MAETLKRIAELLTDGEGPTLGDLLTQENRLTDADRQNLRTIVRWALIEAAEPSPVNYLRFHAQDLIAQYGTTRKAGEALGIDHAYLYRIAAGEKDWPSDDMLLRMGLDRIVTYRPYGRTSGVEPCREGQQ